MKINKVVKIFKISEISNNLGIKSDSGQSRRRRTAPSVSCLCLVFVRILRKIVSGVCLLSGFCPASVHPDSVCLESVSCLDSVLMFFKNFGWTFFFKIPDIVSKSFQVAALIQLITVMAMQSRYIKMVKLFPPLLLFLSLTRLKQSVLTCLMLKKTLSNFEVQAIMAEKFP